MPVRENSLQPMERVSGGEASPTFNHANANFLICVYRLYKESISKEMNNDDLNLRLHDQMSVEFAVVAIPLFRQ